MRRWTIITGLATATVLTALVCLQGRTSGETSADVKNDKRTVTIAGTATIKAQPDSARVTFAVQTLAAQVKLAREENGKKVKKITDALSNLKLNNLKLKPAAEGMELVYSQVENPTQMPEVIGYKVTHQFTATLKMADLDKLGPLANQVLDTALQNGANLAMPIIYTRQEDAEVKRQALARAVEDALANARSMAGAANKTIVDTVTIDGQPDFQTGARDQDMATQYQYMMMNRQQAGDTPPSPNEQEVTCRVVVTCTF
jgi:uncharacterized protein YggE